MLERAPDSEGFHHYLSKLQAGVSKIQILADIFDSPERASSNMGPPGLSETISLYRISRVPLIGRILVEPDFFRPGKGVARRGASAFEIDELTRFDDQQFLEQAYWVLFGRNPDTSGLNFYLERLRNGVPKTAVLGEMMDSPEATSNGAASRKS